MCREGSQIAFYYFFETEFPVMYVKLKSTEKMERDYFKVISFICFLIINNCIFNARFDYHKILYIVPV